MDSKPKKIILTIGVIIIVYFVGLFAHLPIALSSSGLASRAVISIASVIYSPVLRAIDNENWFKIQWQNYGAYWCEQYPDRCVGSNE